MTVKLHTITSGKAAGKQIVVVDGYGSFHPLYEEFYGLGMHHLYLCHSKKEASIKLCFCLQDVADHLGVDCDELVNSLPEGWNEEFDFYPTIFTEVKHAKRTKRNDDWRGTQGHCDFEKGLRPEMI